MVDKNSNQVKKQFYAVKLEVMAPVELQFRILAKSPQEALEQVEKFPLPPLSAPPKPSFPKMRRLKATVYRFGMSTIETVKNYLK